MCRVYAICSVKSEMQAHPHRVAHFFFSFRNGAAVYCTSVAGTRDVVKRALTEEEARFYISEIVAALEWVHLHGYVYR